MRIGTPVLALFVFASGAAIADAELNTAPFNLVRMNGRICRYPSKSDQCLPALDSKEAGIGAPKQIDVLGKIQALAKAEAAGKIDGTNEAGIKDLESIGGALLLSQENRERVLNQFTVLKVRNMAVDTANIVAAEENKPGLIPFVASIDWQDHEGGQGTIHIEGQILVKKQKTDLGSVSNASLADLFEINGLSDGRGVANPEDDENVVRIAERAARTVHFTRIYGVGADADRETVKLVKEVVGPMVVGDTLVVPMLKAFAEGAGKVIASVGQAIGQAFGDMFKSLLGGAPSQPPQAPAPR
jgi:hypothetical protein